MKPRSMISIGQTDEPRRSRLCNIRNTLISQRLSEDNTQDQPPFIRRMEGQEKPKEQRAKLKFKYGEGISRRNTAPLPLYVPSYITPYSNGNSYTASSVEQAKGTSSLSALSTIKETTCSGSKSHLTYEELRKKYSRSIEPNKGKEFLLIILTEVNYRHCSRGSDRLLVGILMHRTLFLIL